MTYRNMRAFYNNLSTPLLQFRLKELQQIQFPDRRTAEKIYVIKQVLKRRES